MGVVQIALSMSLDGFITGPDPKRTRLIEGDPTTHLRFRVLR